MATPSNRLPNRFWGRLRGPIPSDASLVSLSSPLRPGGLEVMAPPDDADLRSLLVQQIHQIEDLTLAIRESGMLATLAPAGGGPPAAARARPYGSYRHTGGSFRPHSAGGVIRMNGAHGGRLPPQSPPDLDPYSRGASPSDPLRPPEGQQPSPASSKPPPPPRPGPAPFAAVEADPRGPAPGDDDAPEVSPDRVSRLRERLDQLAADAARLRQERRQRRASPAPGAAPEADAEGAGKGYAPKEADGDGAPAPARVPAPEPYARYGPWAEEDPLLYAAPHLHYDEPYGARGSRVRYLDDPLDRDVGELPFELPVVGRRGDAYRGRYGGAEGPPRGWGAGAYQAKGHRGLGARPSYGRYEDYEYYDGGWPSGGGLEVRHPPSRPWRRGLPQAYRAPGQYQPRY